MQRQRIILAITYSTAGVYLTAAISSKEHGMYDSESVSDDGWRYCSKSELLTYLLPPFNYLQV